ncbi:MAG: hypothetical protein V1858_04520 [Candidatus Gottesmanbacteria bacterium]
MDETTNQNPNPMPQGDPDKGKINVMALISYAGPLCLIPLLAGSQDEFVKFHSRQGVLVFIGEVITWAIFGIIPLLLPVSSILGLIWAVFSIIGIMNVVKNEKKELPIIGKYAGRIKI